MIVLKNDKEHLLKIRYLYKLRSLRVNDINTDIDFINNYFYTKKRWL